MGFYFPCFLLAGHLHFSLQIQIVENMPTSCFTIHIMNVLRQAPIRVHDVAGKSVVYYPHHEGALFIAKRLHEEISRALPTS